MKAGLLATALLAISFPSASIASAAGIVDRGTPPPVVSKVTGKAKVVSETVADPASAESYWTPARMASAVPADSDPAGSFDVPDLPGAHASAATGDFTPGNVTKFPQVVHGKIFFAVGASNYSCSGTIIDSAKRNVIFTAGHCVFDQETKSFVTNLVFIPGYENQTAPLGVGSAVSLYTTSQWVQSGNQSYDLGVVVLDQPAQKFFGARQIAFDLNPKGLEYTLYGYPSKPNPPYDGEVLRGCHSKFAGRDNNGRNLKPYPIVANPCLMQQGASGGGWVTLGNYVNSVVSYGYCDSAPKTCGFIMGPYFSNAAKALYVKAGGSPAPTVKLRKAPPRVVRKRKVSFVFGGSAATLLGFSCKLDRKRPVPCSARISITRLSPGRHTLRVRAVDQTGRQSRKQIVRSFRVILPRR